VVGATWTPPATGALVLGWTNGVLKIADGNLSAPLSNSVTLSALNKFSVPSFYGMKLTLALNSGRLGGSFKHPNNTNVITQLSGVLLQGADVSCGNFKGTNQSGSILLQAR
jgi:uncharacterized protein YjbI with pentapeptide repeats